MPTPSFRLRSMAMSDYGAVTALWRGTAGIGYDPVSDSRPALARFLRRNPGLSGVAVAGKAVVGVALCGHDGRRGFLYHVAVAEAHRGRGIGTALVARCLAGLAKRGIPKSSLFVLRGNRRGMAFWKRIGWEARADLVVMQKKTMGEPGQG